VSGVPQAMVKFIQDMQLTPLHLLLTINLFLLIVGCLIDPASAVLILTPLLVPLARAAGIDLVHFGIIMTVNLSIGMFTPPFGLNIFVAQALFEAPVARVVSGVLPFLGIQLVALALTSYFPALSLYLVQFIN
jgi:C4-dicarboxylate transporter DctM subunit